MPAIIPLIIIPAAVLASGLWFLTSLPAVISATATALAFCQSLLVTCLAYSHFIKLFTVWAGAVLAGAGFAYGGAKALTGLIKANREIKKLPVKERGGAVVLIDDDNCRTAFTYGLLKPRIYISKGLLSAMEPAEIKGVFLHELHHKRKRDPLKFFLLSMLKDSFFYLPVIASLAKGVRFSKECSADLAALRRMNEPYSLASAIVKAAGFNAKPLFASSALTGSGAKDRIHRLINGTPGSAAPRIRLKTVAISIIITLLMSISMTAPASDAPPCTGRHCEKHADSLGKDCKTHCDVSAKKAVHTH